jgi:hypothetical protein
MFYIKRQFFTDEKILDDNPEVIKRGDVGFAQIQTARKELNTFLETLMEATEDKQGTCRLATPKIKHPTGQTNPAYLAKLDGIPKAVYYIEEVPFTHWDNLEGRVKKSNGKY